MNAQSSKLLVNSLQFYEGIYHPKTLQRLERIFKKEDPLCAYNAATQDYTKNNESILQVSRSNRLYGATEQLKDVQNSKNHVNLLWDLYFKGSQPRRVLPEHLQTLLDHPRDITTHLPYERDHSVVFGENSTDITKTMRFYWKDSLSNIKPINQYIENFESANWLLDKHPDNTTEIQFEADHKPEQDMANSDFQSLLPNLKLFEDEERYRPVFPVFEEIDQEIRNKTLKDVMRQYLFLKNHPKIFQMNRAGAYFSTPVVNIPLTNLGQDIGIKRMKNLFHRKAAHLKNTLVDIYPSLYEPLEDELKSVMSDANTDKKTKLLYKKLIAKSGVYTVKGAFGDAQFEYSSLMNEL